MWKKTMKWLAWGSAALVSIALALYGASRVWPLTETQRNAMDLLAATTPVEGRNAFAALWLLPYGVPAGQFEAITAQDAARFAQRRPATDPNSLPEAEAWSRSVAAGRFGPPLPRSADALLCSFGPGCLASVAARQEQVGAWRDAQGPLIARLGSLSGYDHVRNRFEPRPDTPLPPLHMLRALPTLRALDHLEGRHDAALAGVCRDIAMWRRSGKDTDILVFSMIAVAALRTEVALMADMLAALPADHPLPAACEAAFKAPADAEFGICSAMRGEARSVHGVIAETGTLLHDASAPVLSSFFFDEAATRARMAPAYAWPCGAEALAAVARDEPAQAPPHPQDGLSFECLANRAGCLLASVTPPDFSRYLHRQQDARAWLRLMRTLMALRAQRDDGHAALAKRLAALPADVVGTGREIRLTDDGSALSMRLFDDSKAAEGRLVLRSAAKRGQPG
jgi:hypothetical protein